MFLRQVTRSVLRSPSCWSGVQHHQQRSWLDGLVHRSSISSIGAISTSALLDKWKQRFETEEVSDVESSLRNILAHVLNVKLAVIKLDDLDEQALKLTASQQEQFDELCECRMARMPIQYIIGEWDFRDLTLQMQPPVFIPRPETEELVELILQQFDSKQPMRFLEVGCGSGAISLALLKALPKAYGVAIDQSQLACNLTLSNAKRHQLDTRLTVFREKCTKETLLTGQLDGSVDLIVSNPPYVPNEDLLLVQPEIKLYEDLRALDGGMNGMAVIEAILHLASKRLRKRGVLWLEVDPSHPELLQRYIATNEVLGLKFVASYPDLYRKDRFVEILKE